MTPDERRAKQRIANKKWYAKNREKVLAQHRAWRAAHPAEMKQLNARWYRDNRERATAAKRAWTQANPEYHKTWRLLKAGCTPEQYADLLKETGGACAICGKTPKVLHLDHNHRTGVVRSLLCFGCNTMLGRAHDDPKVLQAATEYLQRY